MNPNSWLLRSSSIYFFLSLVRSTGTTQPLIFNPFTVQVYNSKPNLSDLLEKNNFAIACPALSENEKKFNDKISFDGKALFVRSDHANQQHFPTEMEICETNVQLSAVYHRKNQYEEIQFGYEVYAEQNALPANSYESKYEDYARVSKPGSFKKFSDPAMQKINLTFEKDKKSFIWIEKISIRYDYRKWNIKEVRYEIFRNADQMNVPECTDYDLAKEVYGKENFDEYYTTHKGTKKKYYHARAIKYNLLLPYNFQATPSSPVSCSNLTTVPIWYLEAKTLLINLEHFLIAIGQITKNSLKIHSGIYDDIILRSVVANNSKTDTLYLDQKSNRIRIPKFIYKIVRYQSYNCESKKELCWFEVAIIIQNSPPSIKKEPLLCPKDKCSEWGWDIIQYTNTAKQGEKSNQIYCCKFDETLKREFGFTDKSVADDLNLKDFPDDYDKTKADHIYKDMQKDFEKEMDEVVSKSIFFENKN